MRFMLLALGLVALVPHQAHAQRVRIAAAMLQSGTAGNYNPGDGIRILQGIKADVVLIQQLNYTAGTYASFATTTLGAGADFYRGSGDIPTGILSRYPIVQSGEWTDPRTQNRAFSYAKIDIPGDKFLWAVSVHFNSTSASVRDESATSLVTQILATVPASDYLAIGGSFNSNTRTEPLFTSLSSVVTIPAAFPSDQAGNSNTNSGRDKPYDNLLFDADLQAIVTPTVIGANSFPAGFVLDTRVYLPISDLAPAQVNDSAAHQRMAVLRDVDLGSNLIRVTDSSFTLAPAAWGQITFLSQAGLTYQVQASSTLANGSWQGIGSITAPAGSTTSFQIVPSGAGLGQLADPQLGTAPKRFYRIYR